MLKRKTLFTIIFSMMIFSVNTQLFSGVLTGFSNKNKITVDSGYNYIFDRTDDKNKDGKFEDSKFILSIAEKKITRIDCNDNETVYNLTSKVLLINDISICFYADNDNTVRFDKSGFLAVMKLNDTFSRVYNCKFVESNKLTESTFFLIKSLAEANSYYRIEKRTVDL